MCKSTIKWLDLYPIHTNLACLSKFHDVKMNGPAMALFLAQKRKTQESKQTNPAGKRFQAYVRHQHVLMQQLAILLTHNFFPLVPVRKIWAKPRATKFWEEACQA